MLIKKWLRRIGIFIFLFVIGISLFAYFSSTPTKSIAFPVDEINAQSVVSGDDVTILIDSDAFWQSLRADIMSSSKYVYVQTMSFEADSAGIHLSNAMRQQDSVERRIIADDYSRYYSSDQFSLSPQNWSNDELKKELLENEKLGEQLNQDGVQFKWSNPISSSYLNFPARNHKKLVVIDDQISYIGGINFCDHNFDWHDMMIRIDHTEIAKMQKLDFLASWDGYSSDGIVEFDDFRFYYFDGVNNKKLFSEIFELVEQAEDHIFIESAYLSFPFFEILRKAKKRGVEVTVITPEQNNKSTLKNYIIWDCVRSGFDLQMYQGKMSHLKSILIDDESLIVGSGNYDFLNYTMQIENGLIVSDTSVIAQFKEKVLIPDLSNSITFDGEINNWTGYPRYWSLQIFARLALAINR